MTETTASKTNQRLKVNSTTTTDSDMDAGTRVMIGSMGFISAFIGGGALVCFISALVNAGPLEMVKGFLSALTGF